nr:type II toxin-antitoxin system RelE/ParE family toxin [Morganella morganii]
MSKQDTRMKEKVLASLGNLEIYGPVLTRPYVDTVKNSQYPNMKELRIWHAGRAIRAFFAFDPERQAIILCAGDKGKDKRFYQTMIRIADEQFSSYLSATQE